MNRVRSSIVACVLILGGLGIEATIAQDRSKPASREPSPAGSTAPDNRSNLRKFFDAFKGKATSYPKNRDWTTGRDDAMSKPWLRR